MIYTVTLNPSLDYMMHPKSIILGETNRSERESVCVGGKGINVSIVLHALGIESVALGFTAGFVGEAITAELYARGISSDFIVLPEGNSRINVKLMGKSETEINGNGPTIGESDMQRLFERLDRLTDGDVLVLAGSIPKSLPRDTYERILARLMGRNIITVVDACGELLLKVLKYKPFLVKPNRAELSEMLGTRLDTMDDVLLAAEELKRRGARNVLATLGRDGSILVDEEGGISVIPGIEITPVNTVGAGDSMIAGFICGYLATADYFYAQYLGTACATASAASELLADKERIDLFMKKLGREPYCAQ